MKTNLVRNFATLVTIALCLNACNTPATVDPAIIATSAVQTVEARRDYTYSDANLLAKQDEEKRLNDNMHSDVISSIMRRLAALKK